MNYPFSKTIKAKIALIINNESGCYIFAGEDKYGKDVAVEIVVSDLFKNNSMQAKRSFSNNYIDVSPEEKKVLSIKAIHELNKKISQKTNTKNRLVLINGIDNISQDAANALLKILEDSPKETIFILLCDQIDNVISTIVSRSQILLFNHPPKIEGNKYIGEKYKIDTTRVEELTTMAHNDVSLALQLNNQEYKKGFLDINDSAKKFLSGTITDGFVIAEFIHSKKLSKNFLHNLIYTIQNQSTILNQVGIIEHIFRAIKELNANINSRLVLENLALKINGENK